MGRLDRADGKERELKGVTNPQRRSCRSVEGGGCRSRPVQGGMRRSGGAPPGLGQVYARLPCTQAGPGRIRRSGGAPPSRAPVVEGLERASPPPARGARGCGGAAGRSGWKPEKRNVAITSWWKGGGVARSPSAR